MYFDIIYNINNMIACTKYSHTPIYKNVGLNNNNYLI